MPTITKTKLVEIIGHVLYNCSIPDAVIEISIDMIKDQIKESGSPPRTLVEMQLMIIQSHIQFFEKMLDEEKEKNEELEKELRRVLQEGSAEGAAQASPKRVAAIIAAGLP
jgi:hypothetical protein